MPKAKSWVAKAQERLQNFANQHFANWCQTKAGRKWKAKRYSRKGQPSPYTMGFSLPDFHHDLIAAVGRGDEEQAKFLMLAHYV